MEGSRPSVAMMPDASVRLLSSSPVWMLPSATATAVLLVTKIALSLGLPLENERMPFCPPAPVP
jgi:hypothetical protein